MSADKLTTAHSRSLIIMQTRVVNAGMEVYMLLNFLSSLDTLRSLVLALVTKRQRAELE